MRMRAAVPAALAALLALAAIEAQPALATTPPPCPSSPSPVASGSRTCVNQSGDPTYDLLKQRLGADLAQALTTQQKLDQALTNAAATEASLSAELAAEEARVADLQAQVAALDTEIAALRARIATERAEIAALARAVYQRPNTLLEIIASSGSVSDMLSQTADMVVAGQRAQALQDRLQSDLAQAQSDLDARQSDLDQETATMDQVRAGLGQLAGVQAELDSLSGRLSALVKRIRGAAAGLSGMPADAAAQLALLLEQEENKLAQQEEAAAWAQANVGAGLAADQNLLPASAGSDAGGIALSWPMAAGVVTQPFGPTTFALEPPLGPYAHFHTGIDISAPLGTPVLAAAPGVVVAAAHTSVGYGNYVIVAHGGGVFTLYGHLLETDAFPGEFVGARQLIGREGSTGFSTGPHVHFEVRIGGQVIDPMRFLPPR